MKIDKKLMKHLLPRTVILIIGAILLVHFGFPKEKNQQKPEASAVLLISVMGESIAMDLRHPDKNFDFTPAFDRIRKELADIKSITEDEFVRLNASACDAPFACSGKLWDILTSARAESSPDQIIFDDAAKTVRFTAQGMKLNLNESAKEWAFARIAEELKKQGITVTFQSAGDPDQPRNVDNVREKQNPAGKTTDPAPED